MTEQGRFRFRNAARAADASATDARRSAFAAAGTERPAVAAGRPAAQRGQAAGMPGVRGAWVSWLAPVFSGNDSCYFTGTYSDEYGTDNGLMLVRNVQKDWTRFLDSFGFEGRYIVGVEQHRFRDILHLHGILEGPLTAKQREWIRRWWAADRGHARSLPVLDGCASYVTKYALKGDSTAFEWRLS